MRYVIANWKQNKTMKEAVQWCQELKTFLEGVSSKDVTPVICPPTPFLQKVHELLPGLALGSQDISFFGDGAHTGDVGVNQIKDLCGYSIVGHSERGEPRDQVMLKAKICLEAGITPVICFKSVNDYQALSGAIYALEDPDNISVDGVYHPMPVPQVQMLVSGARQVLGVNVPIIYGGSVNNQNVQELSQLENLDGVLVGNASLDPQHFAEIVKAFFI